MILESEVLARELEKNADYKILRRLGDRFPAPLSGDAAYGLMEAVVLDVETTGLDSAGDDEIISLAMLKFQFVPETGEIVGVYPIFDQYREPAKPISPFITELTGISAEDVQGRVISQREVAAYLDGVCVSIAFNSAFDRQFLEASPELGHLFRDMVWGCGMVDVKWRDHGWHDGLKLSYLAADVMNLFYARHRAESDTRIVLELLSKVLPTGRTALAELLDSVSLTNVRVKAVGAPYKAKSALRDRGYRFKPSCGPDAPYWYKDTDDAEVEVGWLDDNISCSPEVVMVDGYNRFSARI